MGEFHWCLRTSGSDHAWLAQSLGLSREPERTLVDFGKWLPGVDMTTWVWATALRLGLMNVEGQGHNCWETLYHNERFFGLFKWMASRRNKLAEMRSASTGRESLQEPPRTKMRPRSRTRKAFPGSAKSYGALWRHDLSIRVAFFVHSSPHGEPA